MMEVTRQRLQQLMAAAILDLWKKETGSLSSVIIEGTICITSGNGATFVVQVCDKFLGVIPDEHSTYSQSSTSPDQTPKEKNALTNQSDALKVDASPATSLDLSISHIHHNTSSLTSSAYLADVSSVYSQTNRSPAKPQQHTSRSWSSSSDQVFHPISAKETNHRNWRESDSDSDSGELIVDNPQTDETSQNGECKSYSAKADDLSSSGYSSLLSRSSNSTALERTPIRPLTPPSVDARHHYTPFRRRSASPSLLLSPSTSTPIEDSKRPRLQGSCPQRDLHKGCSEGDHHQEQWGQHLSRSRSSSVLDLSGQRSDHELALSAPHNYTAQVHDVIHSQMMVKSLAASSADYSNCDSKTTPSMISLSQHPMTSTVYSASTTRCASVSGMPSSEQSKSEVRVPMPTHHPDASGKYSGPMMMSLADVKVPLYHHNGPASWPIASQEKPSYMPPPPPLLNNNNKQMNNYSLLSVGLPNGIPMIPASLSPSMFPGFFPPGFLSRSMSCLPPGLSMGFQPIPSKPSLASPKTPSSQGSTTPSINIHENEDGRYWELVSGRSTPEVTDINGNSEKSATNGEQKVYVCEYCNKQFLFKSKYHEHLPVHTNARPYQCHLCSRTYKYKYDLQVHLRTHMGIPTKSTVCPFCMQKFDTNKMLRNHIIEVHQDRQKVSKEECTQPLDNLPPAL